MGLQIGSALLCLAFVITDPCSVSLPLLSWKCDMWCHNTATATPPNFSSGPFWDSVTLRIFMAAMKLYYDINSRNPRLGSFVLRQELDERTQHCEVWREGGRRHIIPSPKTSGDLRENRSKLPHCPSPPWVLWGKGQVPDSLPPPHTPPRKRAVRGRNTLAFYAREIIGPELIDSATADAYCLLCWHVVLFHLHALSDE